MGNFGFLPLVFLIWYVLVNNFLMIETLDLPSQKLRSPIYSPSMHDVMLTFEDFRKWHSLIKITSLFCWFWMHHLLTSTHYLSIYINFILSHSEGRITSSLHARFLHVYGQIMGQFSILQCLSTPFLWLGPTGYSREILALSHWQTSLSVLYVGSFGMNATITFLISLP